MLKIKDDVDLKVLENFGFKYYHKQKNQYEHYALIENTSRFSTKLYAFIICEDRTIHKGTWTDVNDYSIILFNLINAGLVEND